MLKNSASYAFGNFTNWASLLVSWLLNADFEIAVYDWPDSFAFILSFLAPLWTICTSLFSNQRFPATVQTTYLAGSFDSTVHISEESSNAATAVPWAIVWAIGIGGVLGWGTSHLLTGHCDLIPISGIAVNVTLAFCMGQDLDGIMNSSFGQPMAQIFFNSFGKEGTLAMWSFIIIAQYMMGSSMVRFSVPSLWPAVSCVWIDNHSRCLLRHANLLPCGSYFPPLNDTLTTVTA